MGIARTQEAWLELSLEVEYDAHAYDPGTPDRDSMTCCPPTAAYAEITAIKVKNIDIMSQLSAEQIESISDQLDLDEDEDEYDDDDRDDHY